MLSDTEKLKLQLDSANKEIEELEIEIQELYEKLIDFSSSPGAEDQEELDAELRKVRLELDVTSSKLKEQVSELTLATQALKFVKDILTAKDVNNTNIQSVINIVEQIKEFVSGDLKDKLNLYNDKESLHLFQEDLERWSITQKKFWLIGKKKIAFIGEFSAGKTSIVNRILTHDDPDKRGLPVSTRATTAIPTYISHSSKHYDTSEAIVNFQFYTPDNKLKSVSEDLLHTIDKGVLERIGGISNLIKYFVIDDRSNNYLENLSILDTPGFSSNEEEDTIRTLEVINECDALFWVFDVNNGTVNESSLNIIKSFLKKPLFLIVNKCDTKSNEEIDQVEQLIKNTFKEKGIEIQKVLRFSDNKKLHPLNVLMETILSVRETTTEINYPKALLDYLMARQESLKEKEKAAEGNRKLKAHELLKSRSRIKHNYKQWCMKLNGLADISEFRGAGLFNKEKIEIAPSDWFKLNDNLTEFTDKGGFKKFVSDLATAIHIAREENKAMENVFFYNEQVKDLDADVSKLSKLFDQLKN